MNRAVMNKRKTFSIYMLTFLAIVCLRCKNKSNEENRILADNLLALIDSTIVDYRILVVPSPTDFIDSLKIKKLKETAQKRKDSLRPLPVIVHDTFYHISEVESFYQKIKANSTLEEYKSIINNQNVNSNNDDCQINLKQFGIQSTKYEILTPNQFQKLYSKNKTFKNGVANYSFSRMYFNESKDLGFFKVDIVYGRLNAYGVIVFIKKEKGVWQVEKIVADWES